MSFVDVRSPGEFAHAHIPGAYSLPLFSDKERAEVGTLYKKEGAEAAFDLGLRFVGPKMEALVAKARTLPHPLTIYCWRGGMRSQSVLWLFSQAGIRASRLEGGYKNYRKNVLNILNQKFPFRVLTGLTGCGKTERLHQLKKEEEQILDLEALANHKGSVFGYLGPQPSNEHFENRIASILEKFSLERPIWIEDESRLIGTCKIPDGIYDQLRAAPMHQVLCSEEERADRLIKEYGALLPEDLIAATKRLQKRLGNERTQKVIETIEKGDYHEAVRYLLSYYDRTYAASLNKKLKNTYYGSRE